MGTAMGTAVEARVVEEAMVLAEERRAKRRR
jgi:hypothetical protein